MSYCQGRDSKRLIVEEEAQRGAWPTLSRGRKRHWITQPLTTTGEADGFSANDAARAHGHVRKDNVKIRHKIVKNIYTICRKVYGPKKGKPRDKMTRLVQHNFVHSAQTPVCARWQPPRPRRRTCWNFGQPGLTNLDVIRYSIGNSPERKTLKGRVPGPSPAETRRLVQAWRLRPGEKGP